MTSSRGPRGFRGRTRFDHSVRAAKRPSVDTLERVAWLQWLVREYGAETVGEWQDPPVTLEEWRNLKHRSGTPTQEDPK